MRPTTPASILSATVIVLALAGAAVLPAPADTSPRVLDDFENVSLWKAAPAAGVKLELSSTEGEGARGRALRLDFDFQGHAGWAAARRDLPLDLPENWEITFSLRGTAPVNDLEVKLVDPSGENVWWAVRRGEAPPDPTTKKCPECLSEVPIAARRCAFCTSLLN